MGIAAIVNTDGAFVERASVRGLMGITPGCSPLLAQVHVDGCVGLGTVPVKPGNRTEIHRSFDGTVWAVFEGRLDDRETLVSGLGSDSRGDLRRASDVVLVVAAYEKWGESCASRLLGDFALCVWDGRDRCLFCARDHFGVKPLYYARVGDALVVSSVLRWVRRYPAMSRRICDEAIGDFLLFGMCAEPAKTSFADISRVPPAHHLSYSLHRNSIRVDRYWTLPVGDVIRYREPREYVEQFSDLFRVAVADRVGSGPVGVLMSGGLDSSSVTAIAADVLGHGASDQLRAFTFAYDSLMEDEERAYSSAIATSLGIPLTRLPADNYAPFDRWDGDSHPAEPTLEGLTAVMSDMLELASGHGGVVLTGDGGDSSLLPSTLFDQVDTMPLASLIADVWRAYGARRPPPIGIRSWIAQHWANEESIPGWLGHELLSVFDIRARWQEVRTRRSGDRGARRRAVSDLTDLWWASTFEGLDPGATQRAVELRYPFFDVRLASFTLRLPSFPWCLNKHILRTAMRGRLPESVRTRRKTPLVTSPLGPRGQWSTSRALELFEATPEVARFVDVRKFRTMVQSDSLLSSETPAAWAAISLAMWLRGEVAPPALDAM